MGTIRRAAVSGLFAAWLAPLTAGSDDGASGRTPPSEPQMERPAERPATSDAAKPAEKA